MVDLKKDTILISNHAEERYLERINDCKMRGMGLKFHILDELRRMTVKRVENKGENVVALHTSYSRIYTFKEIPDGLLLLSIGTSKNPKGKLKKKFKRKHKS